MGIACYILGMVLCLGLGALILRNKKIKAALIEEDDEAPKYLGISVAVCAIIPVINWAMVAILIIVALIIYSWTFLNKVSNYLTGDYDN